MTVDMGIGALGYVGYALESVEGTRVAPTRFLAANSANFNDSNDYLTPMQIRGSRDISVAMPAPFITTGTVELAWVASDIGNILKSAFAASVNSSAYAGGGYTHVFSTGFTSPTMTFETSTQDGVLVMAYTGVRVNTLEIKASFGEIVMASLGLDGIGRAKQGSAATPSYAANSVTPMHFNGVTAAIGGTNNATVKDFTLNVNNNVSHIGTLRATRSYSRVAMGAREIGLGMTMDFQDTAEYDRLLNDSEFAVEFLMEGPAGVGAGGTSNTSLRIALPRVRYKTVGVPINAGDFLSQDVVGTVLQPAAGTAIATVTLVNTENASALLA